MEKQLVDEDPSPAKKLKVKHDHFIGTNDNSDDLQTVPSEKPAKPFAVLATKYTRPIETVLVYVADLLNAKLASKCIRELKEKYPLEDLQHLKRVRRISHKEKGNILQVLIKKVNNDTDDQTSTNIHGLDKELSQGYTIEVPKYQPLSRKQFDEASKLWPSSFHEDKYVAKMISGEIFTDEDVIQMNNNMSLAIQAAKKGKSKGRVGIGAVIVDPDSGKILAIANDLRRKGHPLQHAVMVVIDLVAQGQSGGAWNLGYQEQDGVWVLCDSDSDGLCDMGSTVLRKNEIDVLRDNSSNTSGLCDNDLGRLCEHATGGMCDSSRGGLCDTINSKQQASIENNKQKQDTKDKTGPYLCTGYDLYVTREPCIMCAMSLVHSRIRRVFYGCKDINIGALGSKYNLHVQEGLNHHYEVFCNVLTDQCEELMALSP